MSGILRHCIVVGLPMLENPIFTSCCNDRQLPSRVDTSTAMEKLRRSYEEMRW
jgi:hypothetical protein